MLNSLFSRLWCGIFIALLLSTGSVLLGADCNACNYGSNCGLACSTGVPNENNSTCGAFGRCDEGTRCSNVCQTSWTSCGSACVDWGNNATTCGGAGYGCNSTPLCSSVCTPNVGCDYACALSQVPGDNSTCGQVGTCNTFPVDDCNAVCPSHVSCSKACQISGWPTSCSSVQPTCELGFSAGYTPCTSCWIGDCGKSCMNPFNGIESCSSYLQGLCGEGGGGGGYPTPNCSLQTSYWCADWGEGNWVGVRTMYWDCANGYYMGDPTTSYLQFSDQASCCANSPTGTC